MAKETLDDLQNGFFIYQDTDNFRFGIDAVLLADFVRIKKGDTVCDLGCGTGIIPCFCQPDTKALRLPDWKSTKEARSWRKKALSITGFRIPSAKFYSE